MTKVSGDENTFMIQDMTQELFKRISEIAINSQVQQGGQIKQLIAAAFSPNQFAALQSILNIYKSYFLDTLYPNEIMTFQSKNDITGNAGSSETGT